MKIRFLFFTTIAILSIASIIGSCQWVTIEPIANQQTGDTISFSTEIQSIFSAKCITCHSSRNPVLTEGNAYNSLVNGGFVDIQNPSSSIIVIQTGGTHGGLTPGEKNKILTWIQQGALNN